MASAEKTDELPPSKKWECGDTYQYKIPTNGDPWENLLSRRMESDKAQCESWKDEVQNLLIFAGLFSGVLTAFIIQSYQGLQPNPNDITIALLTRIATRLDNPLNGTNIVAQQIDALPSTSPAPSSIRINIFWFIALIFSLTTVLIGIVSLQWLREHQEYPKSLSSRDRFALFNMRARGLEAWYVPQIFSALPVLLQFSLVLFFVGLVDFLLASQIKVAIPVIIAIGVPLVFLAWTTVAPSLQAFVLCLPIAGRGEHVPEQCPYKSTQSRILRHILTFSRPVFSFISRSTVALHSLVVLLPLRLLNPSLKSAPTTGEDELFHYNSERKELVGAIFETWYEKKWLQFDQAWLTLRDAHAKSISDGEWWMSQISRYCSGRIGGLYDLTNGIYYTTSGENVDSIIQSSAFHCVQDLTSSVIGENSRLHIGNINHNQWLQKLLGNPQILSKPFPTFSAIVEEPPHDLLLDENSFIFLSQCSNPSLTSLQHFAELHIRIFNYIYPKQPLTFTSDTFPSYPDELCLYNYGKTTTNRDAAFDAQISAQFSLAVESFVQSASNHEILDETLLASFHGHGLGELLRYAALRQSEHSIQPTIDFLTTTLTHYTADGKFGQRSDFMFYVSAFYARSLMILDPWHFHYWTSDKEWDDNPIVEAFLPVLRNYLQERGTPDVALGEQLRIPALSDNWWSFFNRDLKNVQDSSREMSDKIDLKSEPEANSGLAMGPDADDRV